MTFYEQYDQQKKMEEKAVEYLNTHLSDDDEEYDSVDLIFHLTTHYRGTDWYDKDLKVFKTLFNSGDEEIRIALWNACSDRFKKDNDYYKDDFTDEENAFIEEVLKALNKPNGGINVNEPIETDRLVLRAMQEDDFDLLARYFKEDGDFYTFTGREPTDKNIKAYSSPKEPLFFTVVEKASNSVVGYVGLAIIAKINTCLLEYYIFKEDRKHGYCKEAVQALTEMALSQKLFLPVITVRENVFDREPAIITSIRARIATTNEPSRKTVQSCGFMHEATLHKTLRREGRDWVDEDIYYLTK